MVLDAEGRAVFLVHDGSGTTGAYWVPPGGALEQGEDHRAAARRELAEETGLAAVIGEELWERRFDLRMATETVHQVERYFLVRLQATAPIVRDTSPEGILER